MRIVSRFLDHIELMSAMFAHTGVSRNLPADLGSEAAYRQAVFRCAACTQTQECKAWLADAAEGSPAPDYCRNADLISRLQTIH